MPPQTIDQLKIAALEEHLRCAKKLSRCADMLIFLKSAPKTPENDKIFAEMNADLFSLKTEVAELAKIYEKLSAVESQD